MLLFSELAQGLDGMDLWEALSEDSLSERTEILHNIDDIWGSAALTVGDWKVLKGTNYKGQWDFWYGPAGNRNSSSYNVTAVRDSFSGKALQRLNNLPSDDIMK